MKTTDISSGEQEVDLLKDQMTAPLFEGQIRKLRLISRLSSFGPEPSGETEQKLTLNDRGQLVFSAMNSRGQTLRCERGRAAPVSVKLIFTALAGYFGSFPTLEQLPLDCGSWQLELTNQEGQRFTYVGGLYDSLRYEDIDLSDLIRNGLEIQDLFAFDGNQKPDWINRIQVEYQRVLHTPPKAPGQPAGRWEYSEEITVDRKRETITLVQNMGSGCRVSHSYQIEKGVSAFLDRLDPQTLFREQPQKPENLIAPPNESRSYTIRVLCERSPERIIAGSYDRYGLPIDFELFAERIVEMVRFYGICEMLAPEVYNRNRRRTSDYIFCSVNFPWSSQSYYYLADQDIYRVGDRVLVPAGVEDRTRTVKIVKIQYFSREDAPMPIEKVKHILGKAEE